MICSVQLDLAAAPRKRLAGTFKVPRHSTGGDSRESQQALLR
jgi:hypothetical protein